VTPALLAPLALACLLLAQCSKAPPPAPEHPQRDCLTTLWVRPPPGAGRVAVIGSWDAWSLPGTELSPVAAAEGEQAGWSSLSLPLPPGEYGYLVQIDGVSGLDPLQPLGTYRGEQEVSLLTVGDCRSPEIEITRAAVDDGKPVVEGTFVAASGGPPLDPSTLTATITGPGPGGPLAVAQADPATGRFRLSGNVVPRGKYTVTIEASGQGGAGPAGGVARASTSVWSSPRAAAWGEGLLYQVLVDRFRGDGGAVLSPPATPGTRAGGTLGGVTAELARGYFDALGVTALWLSPVYQNPQEPRLGKDGHLYDGYHGYWPLASRSVDPRIGGEPALRALIDAAHQRGIKVLLDIVPNHVYEANPVYLGKQPQERQAWFNGDGSCVCGEASCDWGAHIETCWFTPYLPDLRLRNPDAARLQADDALYWTSTFGVDGVRIDAVPMMPRPATRRIARALRDASPPNDPYFVLGEVFTGPGSAGIDAIRYQIGPDGLDSAFDFPLMWALRDALASDRAGFEPVEQIVALTDEAYAGSGEVRARILDNHDTARFLSEAAGDASPPGGDVWASPAKKPATAEPYQRLRVAMTALLTLPGMPVLFHGDEVGQVGGSDPDCRRVMPDLSALLAEESATLSLARRLGQLRACSPALRAGHRTPLSATALTWAFLREAPGPEGAATTAQDRAVVLLSRARQQATVVVPAGSWVDALTGEPFVVSAGGTVPLEPLSARVLLPAASPCLAP
jgi:glycosidase